MNPLAVELNQIIEANHPELMEMLSGVGKKLYFPRGILQQSAEAKEKAHRMNATIGIATEKGKTMFFPSVMSAIGDILPEEALTYAPSFGVPELRRAWQASLFEKNPSLAGKAVSLPIVTCGITHGVSIFTDLWIDPADTVILPDMMWGNYAMIMNVRKEARIVYYPIFSKTGGYNVDALAATIRKEAEKTRKLIVLLNFPHNPTGYTISEDEGKQIRDVLLAQAESGTNIIVVCDDAYFGLFYGPETMKESLFASLCGAHERLLAVKLDGATKENYVWGLRVGFITYGCAAGKDVQAVYNAIERKTAGGIRGNISNASRLGQTLVLKSLLDPQYPAEKKQKFEILKSRATKVKAVLANPKFDDAWTVYPFNSGYFMCLRLKTVKSEPVRRHLLDAYGVGLIALGERDLRVAFSCLDIDEIPELFDIVLQAVRDLEAQS